MPALCQHSSSVMGLGFLQGCSNGPESSALPAGSVSWADERLGGGTAPTWGH